MKNPLDQIPEDHARTAAKWLFISTLVVWCVGIAIACWVKGQP